MELGENGEIGRPLDAQCCLAAFFGKTPEPVLTITAASAVNEGVYIPAESVSIPGWEAIENLRSLCEEALRRKGGD